ncbi:hypothetical protein [Ruegeria atlantica]|uniref:hypothetical protein n=1 Tax=Ruegeria atlantica TaxID=81569 RepID=UPI00147B7191|nr:hypothetical protein [Ruegeria atlantica]
MKVARNTPQQLILSDTPWFFGILFALNTLIFAALGLLLTWAGGSAFWYGLSMIIFGGAMGLWSFHLLVRRVQVIFDRTKGTLVIRQKSIFGNEAIEHALSDLSHAEVETILNKPAWLFASRHRPVLLLDKGMSAGRHPIIQAFSTGTCAERITGTVNDWLAARGSDPGNRSA